MRLLDISADLGPRVSPALLESMVRGIRVATDVARDAELKRLRRSVTEQMKYPTDDELRSAVERFGPGDEQSPRYRAELQLEARAQLRDDARGMPPDIWFDYLYRRQRRLSGEFDYARNAGFERLLSSAPFPMNSGGGLEVLDPVLYHALVADALARGAPDGVGVRELRYSNPFFKRLFGKGTAEKTISATAQVIETVSTLGSTRKMAEADATVARGTVEHRIKDSELDLELKRLEIEREREALLADRIAKGALRNNLVCRGQLLVWCCGPVRRNACSEVC